MKLIIDKDSNRVLRYGEYSYASKHSFEASCDDDLGAVSVYDINSAMAYDTLDNPPTNFNELVAAVQDDTILVEQSKKPWWAERDDIVKEGFENKLPIHEVKNRLMDAGIYKNAVDKQYYVSAIRQGFILSPQDRITQVFEYLDANYLPEITSESVKAIAEDVSSNVKDTTVAQATKLVSEWATSKGSLAPKLTGVFYAKVISYMLFNTDATEEELDDFVVSVSQSNDLAVSKNKSEARFIRDKMLLFSELSKK